MCCQRAGVRGLAACHPLSAGFLPYPGYQAPRPPPPREGGLVPTPFRASPQFEDLADSMPGASPGKQDPATHSKGMGHSTLRFTPPGGWNQVHQGGACLTRLAGPFNI
eukprot:CAMPEP_0174915990 /NCGR_PEP_ID=MMETSP1355-20121228/1499_1 /TAXON_ID=464990 /ORGANISM="Hemiselmis tepida, Strain CCMP443" /LENGTH=107 /DNA_ID=CAMNT_0016160949 /DNA_START=304 /DNA_END=627 /DNA_ORIENTATION=+